MIAPVPGPEQTAELRSAIRRYNLASLRDELVMAAKGDVKVSVVIPARDEAATIGAVIAALAPHRGEGSRLIDEVLVIDDGSTDATAQEARLAGARVLSHVSGGGKGAAMAAGAEASSGELIVFLDGDVENTQDHYIPRLLGPLLFDPGVMLVKGYYQRPFEGELTGGGRVTELCARPALALLFPELAGVRQPLAGETATRRCVLERVGLEPGYRVEMGLLLDVGACYGPASVAEVDLGVRIHRNRPLAQLGPMATEVLAVALERAAKRPGG